MILKLLLILSCSLITGLAHAQATFVVVAANMKDAFTEIQNQFQKENKGELKVIYGSSGNFASQIMNGAPFHLFISADEQYPLELFKKGKTVNEGAVYAIGKLALIASRNKGIALDDSREKIADAITELCPQWAASLCEP